MCRWSPRSPPYSRYVRSLTVIEAQHTLCCACFPASSPPWPTSIGFPAQKPTAVATATPATTPAKQQGAVPQEQEEEEEEGNGKTLAALVRGRE